MPVSKFAKTAAMVLLEYVQSYLATETTLNTQQQTEFMADFCHSLQFIGQSTTAGRGNSWTQLQANPVTGPIAKKLLEDISFKAALESLKTKAGKDAQEALKTAQVEQDKRLGELTEKIDSDADFAQRLAAEERGEALAKILSLEEEDAALARKMQEAEQGTKVSHSASASAAPLTTTEIVELTTDALKRVYTVAHKSPLFFATFRSEQQFLAEMLGKLATTPLHQIESIVTTLAQIQPAPHILLDTIETETVTIESILAGNRTPSIQGELYEKAAELRDTDVSLAM